MKNIRRLNDLIGEQLNEICFVMDYVELQFNGPILRVLTDVVVEHDGQRRVFPGPGSRDALCELIEATLMSIDIDETRAMTLRFGTGHTVIVPLAKDDRHGPEAAHFVPGEKKPIFVW